MTALLSRWRLPPDAVPGVLLLFSCALALIAANSPLAPLYARLIDTELAIILGGASLAKPLLLWVNDGLMALFFLLVGIELKHELSFGHLRSRQERAIPLAAAIGGMLVPALIFLAFNANDPVARNGWAIPAATDIAFALALFAMLARSLPAEVRVFLLAIAIIDDIGAIVIIALLYTADLSPAALMLAGMLSALLLAMNRIGLQRAAPYLLVGAVLWLATLKSGVHATLAGVLVGLALPLRSGDADSVSPGYRVEHGLKPWIYVFVLPVFAFANSGIGLRGLDGAALLSPLILGIAAGLAVGKPLGIVGAVWLGERLGLFRRPQVLNWSRITAVGALCGIGFTMSLFIGSLAFEHAPEMSLADERIGIIAGSLASALLAALLFRFASQPEAAIDARRATGAHGAQA